MQVLHVFISVIVFKFKTIKYLINEQSNCFLEHQGFQNKFRCNINWLDYKTICEAIPKEWKVKTKIGPRENKCIQHKYDMLRLGPTQVTVFRNQCIIQLN